MELQAATEVAKAAGISEHHHVRLPDLKEASDIQTATFAGMPPTYIPMKNAIFYSLAASYAEEVGASAIVGGHNRDDAKTFADAGPIFFGELRRAFWVGSPILRERRMTILLPLSGKTKVQVVKLASSLGVPLELTWSCHREGGSHCWECEGCRARVAAFAKADLIDPLEGPTMRGKFHKE